MPRPRVTFSRNGTTSSGFSGPPKDSSSRASYGVTSGLPADSWRQPSDGLPSVTMLDSYRRVLSRPGALRFTRPALVARLPISMVGLGIVLLVEARDRLLRPRRRVSAAFMLANGGVRHPARAGWSTASARGGCCRSPSSASARDGAARAGRSAATGRSLLTYVFAALAGAFLPQVGACVRPAGRTCSTGPPRCRPRSRSRRCSTRPSSSSDRSWSRARHRLAPGRRARRRGRRGPGRHPRVRGPARAPSPRGPHGTQSAARAADALAHGAPAGRGVPGARRALRRRRGHHRRVRRGAGLAGRARAGCSRSGPRQPARRRRHRRDRLAARPGRAGALGVLRDGAGDGAALLHRVAAR